VRAVLAKLCLLAALGLFDATAACHGGSHEAPEHRHELNLPPVGPTVAVALDGQTASVDLASIPGEVGSTRVLLLTVVKTAFPSVDRKPLTFDLVGSDGFRPMSRPMCTRLLTSDEIARARIDRVTHDVSYDPDLQLPGCYRVRAVVRIEATR
jgi:hypothetical protein